MMIRHVFLTLALLLHFSLAAAQQASTAADVDRLRALAEQGDADAQLRLGLMYDIFGRGPQDYTEAVRWYRRAAEQGNAFAQRRLGVMYANGRGVPQDDAEAVRWYRKAAEQGDASAQFNLGVMYANGRGVPQDDTEAVRWYRRAAEQGHASAQFNLGVMYANGEGVPQDYTEAVQWYRRAAEQGHASAQSNLGLMYEFGRGVTLGPVRAHKWFNLAAARFPASDKDRREIAVSGRDRVAKRLTAAQLAEAQRLAREWRPTPWAGLAPSAASDGGRQARSSRAGVAAVQRALARLGYDPGPADGVPGPRTRAAVRAFQAAAGLPVDGRPSEALRRALRSTLGE